MLMPYSTSLTLFAVVPRHHVAATQAQTPETTLRSAGPPPEDTEAPEQTRPADAWAPWRQALDEAQRRWARRWAAVAQHLQDACEAIGRQPPLTPSTAAPDVFSVHYALGASYAMPTMPQGQLPVVLHRGPSARPARGTSAPPQTPTQCFSEALELSYEQLSAIEADACGPEATCTLTLEPLHALLQPVAAKHHAAVQVYEYAALQQFWRLFPQHHQVTPSYMPIAELCRVVGVPKGPPQPRAPAADQ